MTDIKHIVFDVGRVLIHWDPELPYLDLIPDADERAEFLQNVCTPAWNLEQDRGRSWEEGEQVLIDAHPDKAPLIRAFKKHWIKSVPHAYLDVVALYERLIGSRRDVTLLTNFNQHTFVEASDKYSFLNSARGATVSGLEGLIKPEPEIYSLHDEKHGLRTHDTVFIDDSEANIAAAHAHGWQTVHFTGAQGAQHLAAELAKLGVDL